MFRNISFVLLALVALLEFSGAEIHSGLNGLNIDYDSRIFNGQNSTRGQFPFYALVLINKAEGRVACGGNLIGRQWVLTAAHCVTGATSFEVHLGALNVANFTEPGRVIIKASRAFAHPLWIPLFLWNDIALIRLDRPANLSDTIQLIAVDRSVLDTNTTLTAVGFGVRNTTETTLAPVLQHAEVQSLADDECRDQFPFIIFRRSVFCTVGSALESPCFGDSGGPVVRPNVENPRAPTLVGLTSFGSGSCHLGKPVAYTRVDGYSRWIVSTIKSFEEDSD